jgi:hypothetical protein
MSTTWLNEKMSGREVLVSFLRGVWQKNAHEQKFIDESTGRNFDGQRYGLADNESGG